MRRTKEHSNRRSCRNSSPNSSSFTGKCPINELIPQSFKLYFCMWLDRINAQSHPEGGKSSFHVVDIVFFSDLLLRSCNLSFSGLSHGCSDLEASCALHFCKQIIDCVWICCACCNAVHRAGDCLDLYVKVFENFFKLRHIFWYLVLLHHFKSIV